MSQLTVSSSSSSSGSDDGKAITWERLRVIGRGSYGVVYEAMLMLHNAGRAHPVAVKTSSLKDSASLKKEFRIYRALRGCNEIVHCYMAMATKESGLDLFNLFLDYAPLGTLTRLIRRGIPDEFHVRVYARMMARGLLKLHSKGFVHCDLKPANILAFPVPYGTGVQLRIADLGMAKEVEEPQMRACWRFRGTPDYMSPESVREGAIGPELDVWSLGCIVLEMMTGRGVWRGRFDHMTQAQFMYALTCLPLVPEIPQHVFEAGKDFLLRCFQRDPKQRWSALMLLHHPFLSLPTILYPLKPTLNKCAQVY